MLESLMQIPLTPFFISFKLAGITTLILLFLSTFIAWFLSQSASRMKPFFEAITALPIVLPPSVIGFYILIALSKNSALGAFVNDVFGVSMVFNFTGLVIASCLYSLPFMVQPLQSGFESLPKNMLEASYIAGKSKLTTLFRVALPNIKPSMLSAVVITFAHTVGEFGVVLMVGGSIPNETKTASVAIYEMVEIMDYTSAHIYSGIMVLISFCVLLLVYIFNRKQKRHLGGLA
ncbi:molybdate ABC transporter permease subunit [Sulfurospirillum deleyianum]|uniref:Molybdenum transport system permease n=1 Tax=Sulfurospirillum deleyianum (strain ATCC 51133 / DSM 6946 / 5175) TaxID=525898 RepID=D1B3R2_SULD5|nr:molybdate ABC transporter permease subunit [Sulfurospirillum deleyianum]ACZ12732.1 molybdate ABC transporter, inner membrane subunit [Sulfurospirillum deleyianum DSM 6946]